MRWVRGYRWWERILAGVIAGLAIILLVGCDSPRSKMNTDWDELSENQRAVVCSLYKEKPEADFTGAAIDLGWELGTMMRFLERHC